MIKFCSAGIAARSLFSLLESRSFMRRRALNTIPPGVVLAELPEKEVAVAR
jgi:hypothetical protein